jgi:hypothetical protein
VLDAAVVVLEWCVEAQPPAKRMREAMAALARRRLGVEGPCMRSPKVI